MMEKMPRSSRGCNALGHVTDKCGSRWKCLEFDYIFQPFLALAMWQLGEKFELPLFFVKFIYLFTLVNDIIIENDIELPW